MSELKEIEIKEAYITSQSYPILWIGENGYSITRYGKLLKVKPSYYENEDELRLVIPTLKLLEKHVPFSADKIYIVAGGVPPKLAYIKDIIEVYREEDIKQIVYDDLDFPITANWLLASGLKRKTYGIIYTNNFSLNLFEPLKIAEEESVIGKRYPDTFKVFKQNGKLFIQYLLPKDC